MGLCLEQTPEMGEFAVEVRRESFYLSGPMHLYNNDGMVGGTGTVELALSDIADIRACLDAVEHAIQQ